MICTYCKEPLEHPPEEGNVHPECGFRMVVGSVAHLQRRCHCFVEGSDEHDPPGMTKRQAALAALQLFRRLQDLGVEPLNERLSSRKPLGVDDGRPRWLTEEERKRLIELSGQ